MKNANGIEAASKAIYAIGIAGEEFTEQEVEEAMNCRCGYSEGCNDCGAIIAAVHGHEAARVADITVEMEELEARFA